MKTIINLNQESMGVKYLPEEQNTWRLAAWPVMHRLERHEEPGKEPTYVLHKGLCKGVAERTTSYQSLAEATEAYEALCDKDR